MPKLEQAKLHCATSDINNGEIKKTSTLRHMLDELGEQAVAKIEAIDPSVFTLNNEFWVSYYIMDQIFDKKFNYIAKNTDVRSMQVRIKKSITLKEYMLYVFKCCCHKFLFSFHMIH